MSEEAYLLRFPKPFSFRAGQVTGLTTEVTLSPRLYSIASGENEDMLEILFDVKQEGMLSPRLARLEPGDTLYVTSPKGSFIPSDKESVWVAAGTGIAPYLSMLRSGYQASLLIQGARTRQDLYFHDLLEKRFASAYFPCLSREDTDGFYRGRVTGLLETLPLLDSRYLYYLCGSAEMVVDSREVLLKRGIPYNNILAEVYF